MVARWAFRPTFSLHLMAASLARKYGTHAYDEWSVDELLGLVTRESNPGLRV
jgi:hypothetical protein